MSLSCDHVRDLVAVYKDGATSDVTETDVRRHLKECADCRQYYEEYEQVDRVTYVPDAGDETVSDYAAVATRIRRGHLIRVLTAIGAAVTAAALAFLVARLLFGRRED